MHHIAYIYQLWNEPKCATIPSSDFILGYPMPTSHFSNSYPCNIYVFICRENIYATNKIAFRLRSFQQF